MAIKQVLFYATENELKQGLERFEYSSNINYIETGLFDNTNFVFFDSYKDINGIGISNDGKFNSLVTYLILPKNEELIFEEFLQRDGSLKYSVDNQMNAASITFTPSGEYGDECIIYGTVSGVDVNNKKSILLFKNFEKFFLKGYKKIKSFKVSPQAIDKLDSGVRLTRNINADKTMDLAK